MARILLFYFGLWILSLYYVVFAKGQSCLFKEDESQAEQLCIKVKCEKKDFVIADIQLFAGKTDNEKVKISELDLKCTGETAEFIYQSKKCFWKSECTIQYPRGPMITSRMGEPISFIKAQEGHKTASETKCINKNADVACIIEAKCVRKKNIIDIEDYIRKSKTKIKRKTGIIRSHRLYPWFYDNNKMDKISGYSLTFAKPKELKVGFHDLDIYEGDVITMATNKNTVKFNGTKNDRESVVTFHRSDSFVNITYSQSIEAHNPFRGFIICFKGKKGRRANGGKSRRNKNRKKRQRRHDAGAKKHLCDSVMKRAYIEIRDPYSEACLTAIRSKNNISENCCCNVNDNKPCERAINLARCAAHLAANPDGNCDHIPLM